ncbi:MAG: DUF1501 domain-containing protein [Proteobacteria bacterium]|nr:DUF1501 domain-containing protein [Pseudomonadota bacterium]
MSTKNKSKQELKESIISGSGHGHICHPTQVQELSRRELLLGGTCLAGYMMASKFLPGGQAYAATQGYPPQRRLVWINMSGGWDILEVTDPKVSSTSGIDMMYDWGLAQSLAGAGPNDKIGRWLSRIALQGKDIVVVRGLNMGTTSHMAGSVYMDTGVLSNSGIVNAASIPSIVASESAATIPIIQLNGGSDPKIDRGLLSPVSVVRAQNLELYRSMYPQTSESLQQKLLVLDYLDKSITRAKQRTGEHDRLKAISTAEEKIKVQLGDDVGSKLALTNTDRAPFAVNAPQSMNNGLRDAFALSLKLLKNNLVSCLNLGVGGFDTHANQERQMQPNLESFDYLMATFMNELRASNQLDNTLIVVYSDFGRTPKINNNSGRDHWPFGGALLIGGGIEGGRMVGATDDNLRGLTINETTGARDSSSSLTLSPSNLCGSILDLTLGATYTTTYRTYLPSIAALTKLKTS